jgi:uncharacterized membrane-anchored protein
VTEKRVLKVTKRKIRKAGVSELADNNTAMAVLESSALKANGATAIAPETRRQLVAAEAYFFAERRGFAAGNEVADWVAAEVVVDSRLRQQVA